MLESLELNKKRLVKLGLFNKLEPQGNVSRCFPNVTKAETFKRRLREGSLLLLVTFREHSPIVSWDSCCGLVEPTHYG